MGGVSDFDAGVRNADDGLEEQKKKKEEGEKMKIPERFEKDTSDFQAFNAGKENPLGKGKRERKLSVKEKRLAEMPSEFKNIKSMLLSGHSGKITAWNHGIVSEEHAEVGCLMKSKNLGNGNIHNIVSVGNHAIAAAFRDGGIRVYNLFQSGKFLSKEYKLFRHKPNLSGLSIFGIFVDWPRRLLFSAAHDKKVKMWSLKDGEKREGKCLNQFDTAGNKADSVIVLGNSPIFAAGAQGGWIVKYDFVKGKRMSFQQHHESFIFKLDHCKETNLLFTVSGDKTSKAIDMRTDQVVHNFDHSQKLQSLLYVAESHELFLGDGTTWGNSSCGTMLNLDVRMWKVKEKWRAHQKDLGQIVKVPSLKEEGKWDICTRGRDGKIIIWSRGQVTEKQKQEDENEKFKKKTEIFQSAGSLCYVSLEIVSDEKKKKLMMEDIMERKDFIFDTFVDQNPLAVDILFMKNEKKIKISPILMFRK